MSPRRKLFQSIIGEDAADFDYGDAVVWFGWKCCCCNDYAYDGNHLEMQFMEFEKLCLSRWQWCVVGQMQQLPQMYSSQLFTS